MRVAVKEERFLLLLWLWPLDITAVSPKVSVHQEAGNEGSLRREIRIHTAEEGNGKKDQMKQADDSFENQYI